MDGVEVRLRTHWSEVQVDRLPLAQVPLTDTSLTNNSVHIQLFEGFENILLMSSKARQVLYRTFILQNNRPLLLNPRLNGHAHHFQRFDRRFSNKESLKILVLNKMGSNSRPMWIGIGVDWLDGRCAVADDAGISIGRNSKQVKVTSDVASIDCIRTATASFRKVQRPFLSLTLNSGKDDISEFLGFFAFKSDALLHKQAMPTHCTKTQVSTTHSGITSFVNGIRCAFDEVSQHVVQHLDDVSNQCSWPEVNRFEVEGRQATHSSTLSIGYQVNFITQVRAANGQGQRLLSRVQCIIRRINEVDVGLTSAMPSCQDTFPNFTSTHGVCNFVGLRINKLPRKVLVDTIHEVVGDVDCIVQVVRLTVCITAGNTHSCKLQNFWMAYIEVCSICTFACLTLAVGSHCTINRMQERNHAGSLVRRSTNITPVTTYAATVYGQPLCFIFMVNKTLDGVGDIRQETRDWQTASILAGVRQNRTGEHEVQV